MWALLVSACSGHEPALVEDLIQALARLARVDRQVVDSGYTQTRASWESVREVTHKRERGRKTIFRIYRAHGIDNEMILLGERGRP